MDTVRANRAAAWALAQPLFAWSPRIFCGWRRFMPRRFGAQVGRVAHIYFAVRIAIRWNLTIGDQAAIGDRAILYALGTITIEENGLLLVAVTPGAITPAVAAIDTLDEETLATMSRASVVEGASLTVEGWCAQVDAFLAASKGKPGRYHV